MHRNVALDALPGSATFVHVLDCWLNDCTQECKGGLTPIKIITFGLGDVSNYNGCGKHKAHFETSSKNELFNTSDISM